MKILGITPFHDSSACLYEDRKIISFYKEERLTRVKRDSIPILSIQKIVDDDAYRLKNLDFLAWAPPKAQEDSLFFFKNYIEKYNKNVTTLDFSSHHHMMHASLAFYNSGFDECAVIVVDRNGSFLGDSCRESESIFYCSYPDNIIPVYKNYWALTNSAHLDVEENKKNNKDCEFTVNGMYGIVKVYETATSLIMQHALENGKTMGLAAYGNANYKKLFHYGNMPIDSLMGHEHIYDEYAATNLELQNLSTKKITEKNYKIYANYAKSVQVQTQDAVCFLIEKAIKKLNINKICITGGYGLNVVANYFYTKKFPNIKFYFEPIADDTGVSIGASMFTYRNITKDKTNTKINNTFFHGNNKNLKYKNNSHKEIAKLLLDNKSVGVFYGQAEAGPRALGNRSILFNATNKNAKNIVNLIKQREWYRPFAASVLLEDFNKYFITNGLKDSPFMTVSFPVKKKWIKKIPGVVHIDNTCRVQTVDKNIPHLYALLSEIKKNTGIGLILNTSFNLAGESLVETKDEAIEVLKKSTLDCVWFPADDIIVYR